MSGFGGGVWGVCGSWRGCCGVGVPQGMLLGTLQGMLWGRVALALHRAGVRSRWRRVPVGSRGWVFGVPQLRGGCWGGGRRALVQLPPSRGTGVPEAPRATSPVPTQPAPPTPPSVQNPPKNHNPSQNPHPKPPVTPGPAIPAPGPAAEHTRVLGRVCVCSPVFACARTHGPGGGRGCPPTRWAPLIGRGGRPKSAARAGSHLSPAAHRIKGPAEKWAKGSRKFLLGSGFGAPGLDRPRMTPS